MIHRNLTLQYSDTVNKYELSHMDKKIENYELKQALELSKKAYEELIK